MKNVLLVALVLASSCVVASDVQSPAEDTTRVALGLEDDALIASFSKEERAAFDALTAEEQVAVLTAKRAALVEVAAEAVASEKAAN